MGGYLVNFSIYTLAMVGVIFGALFLFKGLMTGRGFSKKSEFLNVEESISLSPRKSLYVIKAGEQRFLVAADVERTSLIAQLDERTGQKSELKNGQDGKKEPSFRQDKSFDLASLDGIESMDEFTSVINFKKEIPSKQPLMRELAKRLNF